MPAASPPAVPPSPRPAPAGRPGVEGILERAYELAAAGPAGPEAVGELAAGAGDRRLVEAARDAAAAKVHARVDDFEATAVLQLLNRALSKMPVDDPLDWRVRWTQRFRKP